MTENKLPPITVQELNAYDTLEVAFGKRSGLTAEKYAEALEEGTKATIKPKGARKEIPDLRTRLTYWQQVSAARGWNRPEKIEHLGGLGVSMALDDEDRQLLRTSLNGVVQAIIKQAHTEED